jgi:hypothetical protein
MTAQIFNAQREVSSGLIQFHFGLKTKFIFNQGITPWN